jgi:hypothetical protein
VRANQERRSRPPARGGSRGDAGHEKMVEQACKEATGRREAISRLDVSSRLAAAAERPTLMRVRAAVAVMAEAVARLQLPADLAAQDVGRVDAHIGGAREQRRR